MKSQFTLLSTCLLLAMAAVAAAQVQKHPMFDRWDKNSDGRLTRDELPAGARQNFDRADTDNDGFISPAEDLAIRARFRQDRQPARPATARPATNRPAPPRFNDTITVEQDLFYADNENRAQSLDVYLPARRVSDRPLPLLVWIHGGGWRGGDKRGGGQITHLVASGRYVGASINYRLSGEATWPAQIHDCKAAIRWLRANAAKYGFDPTRIAVLGGSAGGHLVAAVGTMGDVASLEGKVGSHSDQSSAVTCVVDFYGPTDLLQMSRFPSTIDHDAASSPESLLVGGPIQERKEIVKQVNPITHLSKGDPPILIAHGTDDKLVPFNQSELLYTAMKKQNLDVTLITMKGGGHGGWSSNERLRAIISLFLEKHLYGKDAEITDETIVVQ